MSDHFSVDGTLIEAWASIKCFRRKDGEDISQRWLDAAFTLALAAYNLIRLPKLLATPI